MIGDPKYHSIYFYHQHGPDVKSAIYPATDSEPVRRISKGKHNIAVIKESNMEFVVHRVPTEGHTNLS